MHLNTENIPACGGSTVDTSVWVGGGVVSDSPEKQAIIIIHRNDHRVFFVILELPLILRV